MTAVPPQASKLEISLQQAILHHQAGRVSEAERLYRRVLRERPSHPAANNALGIALRDQGKLDEAAAVFQRAAGQLYQGKQTHMGWTAREIVLPTIAGSLASGAIIRVAGITGRIRGMKHKRADGSSARPSLVLIDDPQTDESARSPSQCANRERILAGAILGLAGPGKKIAGLMTNHEGWSDQEKAADAKPVHIEKERRSAKELGIPMPTPTIKPLFVAAGIIIMLSGLIFLHKDDKTAAFSLIAIGAAMIFAFVYAWVTTPLEPEH